MSAKSCDHHNRWRSKTVAFRMSPEECEQLDRLVAISGLTKQDYIIRRLLERDVVVIGNPRVFKALRAEMRGIQAELQRLSSSSDIDDDLRELLQFVTHITAEMNEKES